MNETAELIQQQNLQALMRKQVEQTTKLLEKEEQNSRTAEIADRLETIEKRLEMIETMLMVNHANTIANLAQAQGAPIPQECVEILKAAIRKTS